MKNAICTVICTHVSSLKHRGVCNLQKMPGSFSQIGRLERRVEGTNLPLIEPLYHLIRIALRHRLLIILKTNRTIFFVCLVFWGQNCLIYIIYIFLFLFFNGKYIIQLILTMRMSPQIIKLTFLVKEPTKSTSAGRRVGGPVRTRHWGLMRRNQRVNITVLIKVNEKWGCSMG